MKYRYVACSPAGEVRRGEVETDTERGAEEALWQAGLTIIRLRRAREGGLEVFFPSFFGPRRSDVIHFTRGLAHLLGAGIPLVPALGMLREQAAGAAFRRVLRDVIVRVSAGDSFSQALSHHPKVFPALYQGLVQVGEGGGGLVSVLRQLGAHLEREQQIGARLRRALSYPAFVLLLAGVVVFIMVTFVLPALRSLMLEWGGQMPWATRWLVAAAGSVRENLVILALGHSLMVLGAWTYGRTVPGRRLRDQLLLRVPQLGRAILYSNLARASRTLSLLLRSGVLLGDSLGFMRQTMENVPLQEALGEVQVKVAEGQLLSQAMASRPIFPPLARQLVALGEQTGQLATNLDILAVTYEEETERLTTRLVGMVEPALILVVGGIIAFIAVAILSPIYSLARQVR